VTSPGSDRVDLAARPGRRPAGPGTADVDVSPAEGGAPR
jgi:hypothetical protein